MNHFGVNLTGKRAIYKKEGFYKPNATKPTRTFICESGPGCDPKSHAPLGLLFGDRTVTGRWESDGSRDTLNVNSFDAYFDLEGNEVELKDITAAPPVEVVVAPARKTEEKSTKEKPAPAAAPVAEKEKPAATPATPAPAVGAWNPDRVIELYKAGTKVSDIAVAMGYERGQGNNRVRGVLKAAGIYKESK